MVYLERTRQLYRTYVQAIAKANQGKSKQAGGLFGFLMPAQDPCHNQFVEDMSALMGEAAQADLSPEESRTLLEFIYQEAQPYKNDKVIYWMLLAAHAMALPLVERLTAEDAAQLRIWYEKTYPRSGRLPAQKELVERLKAAEMK